MNDTNARPVPRVRLFVDRVVAFRGVGASTGWQEIELPLIQLGFDYPGIRVAASDPGVELFQVVGSSVAVRPRDLEAEVEARRILESFGAVDLECLEDVAVSPDCGADYLVRCDGDAHTYCAFTADVLPRLRALGWQVEVDEAFPYQVVEGEVRWYAHVERADERPGWFELELGVEVDGKRVSLLPVLLELLDANRGPRSIRTLAERVQRAVALPVGRNRWVTVPPDRLRKLVQVIVELYQGARTAQGRIAFEEGAAIALPRLDDAFAGAGPPLFWQDDAGVKERAGEIFPPYVPATASPPGLRATLRPYQRRGLDWLQHLVRTQVGGILADDMGLGKTLQTIAHLSAEKAAGRMTRPSLVVGPTSLSGTWCRELERFAPHLRVVPLRGPRRHERLDEAARADVIVTSYPLMVRDLEALAAIPLHLLVLDEAHTIKNARTRVHAAARRLEARHRLCLTGTPVENHLGELWSIVDFLNPGLLGDARAFQRWYQRPIEEQGDELRLRALHHKLAPYVLRRVKEDVAPDLPPRTELLQAVELEGPQRELYESIRVAAHESVRRAIRKRGFESATISILDALTKLRQVCCDPRLVRMDAARKVRTSAKLEALERTLDASLRGGHRVLVFSQFTSMLAIISRLLRDRGTAHLVLTGQSRHRQALVDAFQAGAAPVFLISLKAGGTGLTLTEADTVIHYDHWWNPAAQAQATDRAHRIGQDKPVFVHKLYVAGSVEERMLELQRKKKRLADAILGDAGQAAALTPGDVERLFAPLG